VRNPSMHLNSVDFPAPLGPMIPKKSPSSIPKLMSSNALIPE